MVQVSTSARSLAFASLSDEEFNQIVNEGKVVSFQPGELVIRHGDHGDIMYFILKGMVEVQRRLGTGGPQFSRFALGEGEFFGEIALLLEGEVRTANVLALEPTTCLMMTSPELEELVHRYPSVALGMLKAMSRRLRALGT